MEIEVLTILVAERFGISLNTARQDVEFCIDKIETDSERKIDSERMVLEDVRQIIDSVEVMEVG